MRSRELGNKLQRLKKKIQTARIRTQRKIVGKTRRDRLRCDRITHMVGTNPMNCADR